MAKKTGQIHYYCGVLRVAGNVVWDAALQLQKLGKCRGSVCYISLADIPLSAAELVQEL